MKKALIVVLCVVIFLACFLGYMRYQSRDDINIVTNRGSVSSDRISAEITNISYEDGWLSGTINIYDESISTDYNAKADKSGDFESYLSAKYDLTIEIDDREQALAGDSGGFTVTDSGYGFYTKSFTHYLKDPANRETIRIHICGIDEPLEIMLKVSGRKWLNSSKNIYENSYYSISLPKDWEVRDQTDFSAKLVHSGQDAAIIEVADSFQYGGSTEEIVDNYIGMRANIISEDEVKTDTKIWSKVTVNIEESAAQEIKGEVNPDEIHYFYLSEKNLFIDVYVLDENSIPDIENVIGSIEF